MERHDDSIADGPEYDVIDAGIYKGHIFGVQARDSNPSQKPGANLGKTFPMYRFFLRLTRNIDGTELPKAIRLRKDLFAAGQAPGIKNAFIADAEIVKINNIPDNQADLWKQDSPVGKACFIEVVHRHYQRETGTVKMDENGTPLFDPETNDTIPIVEDAIALDVKHFYAAFRGSVLNEAEMRDIDFNEQHEIEEVSSEEIPDADEEPAF